MRSEHAVNLTHSCRFGSELPPNLLTKRGSWIGMAAEKSSGPVLGTCCVLAALQNSYNEMTRMTMGRAPPRFGFPSMNSSNPRPPPWPSRRSNSKKVSGQAIRARVFSLIDHTHAAAPQYPKHAVM